jgi:hypothetical protein
MATDKNFIVKNGLEVGGQEVISSSGVVSSAALGGQTLGTTDSPTFANTTLTGNIVVSGTVDGRDVATDGTKLDGIEANATADQTQSEINALGITATGLSGTPNITVGTISSGAITASTSSDYPLKVLSTDSFSGLIIGDNSSTTNGNAIAVVGDSMRFYTGGTTSSDIALTLASNNNATFAGTITSNDGLYATGIWANNNVPSTDDAIYSGYGAIGNRTNYYITNANASGQIVMGISGGHNANPKLTIGASSATFSVPLTATSFSDGTISGITFIDEDSFATNSATRVPTQQSIKAYVDTQVAGVVDSAPAALDTLNELAAALGDDANFSTTTSTALGNRLRVDTAAQGLTGTQQANAITNLGITATKAELNYVDGVTSNIQTQLDGKQATGSYLTGNQTITLSGDVSGSGTTSIAVTIADDSHNHVISNVDGLQTALDAKMPLAGGSFTGDVTFGTGADFGSAVASSTTDLSRHLALWGTNYGLNITSNNINLVSAGTNTLSSTSSTLYSKVNHDFSAGIDVTGNITVTGTVDGRDIASDGSKLDGIESGATADQTAAQILTAIKTVDGAGSGLDADLLDGQHGSYYLDNSNHTNNAGYTTNTGTVSSLSDLSITSTAAELNKLDGYTGSVTELNYLDTLHATGVTSTEFDYLDGVTSNIQTQLNGKQATGSYLTGNQTITLSGDVSGSGTTSIAVTVANDSHTHDGRYYTESESDARFTSIDDFRHTGHGNYTSTTTSALLTEALGDDAFDSKLTAHKTSWSYAGNGDLTDAGRLTELAGTSWLWWTDNSANNVQGNITALAIAPNTGGSAGKMFVYNDQGSSYAPGWREIWTSTSDGSGSGLDADLLDGQEGSYYLNYNNFTNTPTIPSLSGYATETYVGTQISNLVDSAPSTLDTLNELAAALGDDANFSTTVTNSIATKLPLAGGTMTGSLRAQADLNYFGLASGNNEGEIVVNTGQDGSPQIGFTEHGDASWAIGIDDADNSFKIHGTDTSTIPTINNLAIPLFEITTTAGTAYLNNSRIFHDAYHPNADTLTTARTISLTGAVTGSVSFNGSSNVSIATTATADPTLTLSGDASGSATFTNLGNATLSVTIADDSHNHVISNVDGLQTALDAKLASSSYTAADVLTKIKTVDGAGSGLDADTLDGISSASFLRSDAADTFTTLSGTTINLGSQVSLAESSHRADLLAITSSTDTWGGITIANSSGETLTSFMGEGNSFGIYDDINNEWALLCTENSEVRLYHNGSEKLATTSGGIDIVGNITLSGTVDGRDIATDGTKLDGIAANANNYVFPYTVSVSAGNNTVVQRHSSGYIYANYFNGTGTFSTTGGTSGMALFTGTNGTDTFGRSYTAAAARALLNVENGATADQTAAEILTAIKTVDGAGSGLDADLLDGISSASFLRSDATDTFTTLTGTTLTVNGVLSVRDAIDLADNDILRFGSGDDVEFFCNGTHMYTDLNSGIGNWYIRDGTTTRFTFDDAGDFTATGNVTAYSDERLKDNILVIDGALEKVSQLRGVTFNRTDTEEPRRQTGVIAQEVEKVLPEAVITADDEMQTKSVAYGNMVGLLIEAIKELKTEVNDLKKQLKEIK